MLIDKSLRALGLHDGAATSGYTRGEVFVDNGLNTFGLHDSAATAGNSRREMLIDRSGKSVWGHFVSKAFVEK